MTMSLIVLIYFALIKLITMNIEASPTLASLNSSQVGQLLITPEQKEELCLLMVKTRHMNAYVTGILLLRSKQKQFLQIGD